jgi:WD40 repeat protein
MANSGGPAGRIISVLLSLMVSVSGANSEPTAPAVPVVAMAIRQIAFSPDGQYLAAAYGNSNQPGCLALWQWQTNRLVFKHDESVTVTNVSYSPSGKLLAIGMLGPAAKLVSAETGKVIREFRGHANHVRSVAFVSDEVLATGSYDHSVRLWESATGNQLIELGKHIKEVRDIAASADGKWLLSGGVSPEARLWNIAERKQAALFEKNESICPAVGFSRDSAFALTGSWDAMIRIYQLDTREIRAAIRVNNRSFDFSPDNHTLVVCNDSPTIKVIPVTLEALSEETKQQIDGLIATWHDDDYAKREAASVKLVEVGMIAEPQLREAMKSESAEVRIRARLARAAVLSPEPEDVDVGHDANVAAVRFSPYGRCVATGDADGIVRVWEAGDRSTVSELRLPPRTSK